jgi:FkbM family methyltransferase
VIGDIWRYRVVKQGRKAFWLPYARLRRAFDRPAAGNHRAGRTAYGVHMLERWHDRTFIYCRAGIYGKFLASALERRTDPFLFVDIGANQGLYSLIAARNPACRAAIAFEPVAETFGILNRNIALNKGSEKVRALKLAISGKAGTMRISVPAGHSGMASLAANPSAARSVEEGIETICAAELEPLLAGTLPLVVKVDVEGHEAVVIRELLSTSASTRIEAIFYEIDTRWSAAEDIAAMLRHAGFTRFRKVGAGHHFDVLAER